jgi:hypothetical protein
VVVAVLGLADERTKRAEERTQQAEEEARAAIEGRLSQARRISAWLAGGREGSATLLNSSEEPVYRVVIWIVDIQGAGPETGEAITEGELDEGEDGLWPAVIALLPPGTYRSTVSNFHGGMGERPGVEIAFTDATGLSWIRRSDGRLEEINEDPVVYYKVDEPLSFEEIEVLSTP